MAFLGSGGTFCLELAISLSGDDEESISHHGDADSPSEAVWNEDALEGGVPVHSEAVTKSSSDLLLSDLLPFSEVPLEL